MFKIELGAKVKDRITGFTGIVGSRTEYLTGCRRYGVQFQKLSKDGKPQNWQYFDEDMLTVCRGIFSFTKKENGGPVEMEAPQR